MTRRGFVSASFRLFRCSDRRPRLASPAGKGLTGSDESRKIGVRNPPNIIQENEGNEQTWQTISQR
jgi:hypothetical protein